MNVMEEVETGQRPEWKDITDCSPTYKRYWAQWKSLSVRNGTLKCHCEYADGRSKIAEIILPWNKVNVVLTELHGGSSGGHFGINKTLDKVRKRYYRLQARNDVEKWCRQCDTCAASHGPRTRNRG
jgi:hypothetical protein